MCLIAVSFTECCNCRKYNFSKADIDTIITIDNSTVVKQNDTLLFLWEKTSSAMCKPVPKIIDKKEKNNKMNSLFRKLFNERPNFIILKNYKLIQNKNKSTDSILIYGIAYNVFMSQEIVRAIKINSRVKVLDYRDRKMFYDIMNFFESYLGYADNYSVSYSGKKISRDLAPCVVWKRNGMEIILFDDGYSMCSTEERERTFSFVLKKR